MHHRQRFLLFAISPEVFMPEQLRQVNNLFQEGLDYLYIRSEMTDAAAWHRLLEKISPDFYSRLLLPGNAPKAAAAGAYIRHIRERERLLLQPGEAGRQVTFSTSVHQLKTVPQLAGLYEYVFYSPLFPSISKPGYEPQQGLTAIGKQLAGLPPGTGPAIIGLGGVRALNIAWVKAAGFQGAALLGALWQTGSPVKALVEIKQAVRESTS